MSYFGSGTDSPRANLNRKSITNLGVTRHRLHFTRLRIDPKRVRAAFTLQATTMAPQMAQESGPLHSTTTTSRSASAGTPRIPSSRRSSRISAIASRKLLIASCLVCPCPLAPGTSGQYAIYHVPSCSITAVNSFRIKYLASRVWRERHRIQAYVAEQRSAIPVVPHRHAPRHVGQGSGQRIIENRPLACVKLGDRAAGRYGA